MIFKLNFKLKILYPIDADWVYAKSLINIQQDSGGILPVNHLRILKLPSFESNKVKLFLATENFGEESGDLYFTKGSLFQIINILIILNN